MSRPVVGPDTAVLQVGETRIALAEYVRVLAYEQYRSDLSNPLFGDPDASRLWEVRSMPFVTLERLVDDELIRESARVGGLRVATGDVDALAEEDLGRSDLGTGGIGISGGVGVESLYRRSLRRIGMSRTEHRRILRVRLLRLALEGELMRESERWPHQVDLRAVLCATRGDASAVRERLTGEYSWESVSNWPGVVLAEVIGWTPEELLAEEGYGHQGTLGIGIPSEPTAQDSGWRVFIVTDRSGELPVGERHMPALRKAVLRRRFGHMREETQISRHFNSDIYAWAMHKVRERQIAWWTDAARVSSNAQGRGPGSLAS